MPMNEAYLFFQSPSPSTLGPHPLPVAANTVCTSSFSIPNDNQFAHPAVTSFAVDSAAAEISATEASRQPFASSDIPSYSFPELASNEAVSHPMTDAAQSVLDKVKQ